VLAKNAVGSSALSSALTVLAAVEPSAPQNLVVTDSTIATIDIEWDAPSRDGGSSLTGYYAYYKLSGAGSWTQSALISKAVNTFQLTSLTANSLYLIKMVAVNSVGEGDDSDIVNQYSASVPTSLTAPTVVASSRTSSSMGLQWAAPGSSTVDILGYQLYVNEGNSNSDPSILIYDGS